MGLLPEKRKKGKHLHMKMRIPKLSWKEEA
jgi:hypothetical protein